MSFVSHFYNNHVHMFQSESLCKGRIIRQCDSSFQNVLQVMYTLPQIILPIISLLFCTSYYPCLKTSRIIILRQQDCLVICFSITLQLKHLMITLYHKTKQMIDSTKTNQCCDYRLTDAVSVIIGSKKLKKHVTTSTLKFVAF